MVKTTTARGRSVTLTAAIAAVGGMLFGYDTGVISGALLFIRSDFHLGSFAQESVVAALLIGAVIGAAGGGWLSDRIGRRRVVLITALTFIAGVLWAAFSPVYGSLLGSRVVIGLAVGSSSMVVPLYISEMAPPARRGGLVSLNQLAITVGILSAALIDYALSPLSAWRWMLGLAVIPAAVLFVGALTQAESPAWLVERGREDEARDILRQMRGSGDDIEGEIEETRAVARESRGARLGEVLAPRVRPALMLGVTLAVLQQITGINTVIYYAPTLLKDAGLGSSSSILGNVVVDVINVLLTIVAIRVIDRAGRRPLLIGGTAVMCVALAALGMVFAVAGDNLGTGGAMLAIVALCVYVGAFAIGLGPVFWLLISEIYPLRIRGGAMSVATMANWASNFLVAETFLTMLNRLGRPLTFFIYAGVSVLSVVYMVAKVPETRGRTLPEIELDLRGVPQRDAVGAGAGTAVSETDAPRR